MFESLHQFDVSLFYRINRGLENSFFDGLMPIVSNLVWFIIPLLLILIYLVIRYKKQGYVWLAFTMMTITTSELVVNRVLKPAVARYRPCNERGDIHLFVHGEWIYTPEWPDRLYKPIRSYSFPSSHAANVFAVAMFWFLLRKRKLWFLLLIATLVAFSRVYLGLHYPLDVVSGAAIGSFTGYFWFVFQRTPGLTFGQYAEAPPGKPVS